MKKRFKFQLLLTALTCLLLSGCSQGYNVAPVSGVVTIDGVPADGINIVFYPKGSKSNPNPGPYSSAVSGADGTFTLKTRDGENGAIVGEHRVAIEMGDAENVVTDEMLGEAESQLDELMGEPDAPKSEVAQARKAYQRLKRKQAATKKVPAKYQDGETLSFTVEAGGTDAARIEL